MTQAARLVLTLVAVLVAASGLAACGADEPPVCDDLDALASSVGNLKDVQISENGPTALSADLTQIRQDLQQLGTDAAAEFGDDASKVESAVTSLRRSVATDMSEPSASTLSAVGAAIEGVASSLSALPDAVSGTC